MTAPTHILTGLASIVVLGRATGITPDSVGLLALIVGTLAPDIDGNGSITRPGTILRQLLGRGIGRILDAVFEILAALVNLMFGHRGFIHSPAVAIALMLAAVFTTSESLFWFGAGYLTHILGDAMTPAGVPLLSPLSNRRFALGWMKTGSGREGAVAVALLLFVCVFGWALLPAPVRHTHEQLIEALAMSM